MRPGGWTQEQWEKLAPLRRLEYRAQMIEKVLGAAHHSIWNKQPARARSELREVIAMCKALLLDLDYDKESA